MKKAKKKRLEEMTKRKKGTEEHENGLGAVFIEYR